MRGFKFQFVDIAQTKGKLLPSHFPCRLDDVLVDLLVDGGQFVLPLVAVGDGLEVLEGFDVLFVFEKDFSEVKVGAVVVADGSFGFGQLGGKELGGGVPISGLKGGLSGQGVDGCGGGIDLDGSGIVFGGGFPLVGFAVVQPHALVPIKGFRGSGPVLSESGQFGSGLLVVASVEKGLHLGEFLFPLNRAARLEQGDDHDLEEHKDNEEHRQKPIFHPTLALLFQ